MKANVKKYAVVMGTGLVLNVVLYSIAHSYHLPVWMDTIGTCYAAMMLEPAAGVLIGFFMNFYQAVFIYDYTSIIYFISSAAAAVAVGTAVRKKGELKLYRLPLAVSLTVVINTAVSSLLTIWRNGGFSDSLWERYFMDFAMEKWGTSVYAASLFGTFVLKVLDGVILLAALFILYFLTPEKWKNRFVEPVVSWKNNKRKEGRVKNGETGI